MTRRIFSKYNICNSGDATICRHCGDKLPVEWEKVADTIPSSRQLALSCGLFI